MNDLFQFAVQNARREFPTLRQRLEAEAREGREDSIKAMNEATYVRYIRALWAADLNEDGR